ncbi:hypothetical protein QFZ77_000011 [Paenibacillus sp. V4I3]|uniref:hypothetical protein n=1 Tax=Paenibacillus sp. V4I3 TaxID=3042305 RepID=UPI00278709BB|nr:hypothetical protein [Paenibacillus sp. V4I3]MDQ0871352.1 hypothetical protein [Paenibacillus sp. V4I3]
MTNLVISSEDARDKQIDDLIKELEELKSRISNHIEEGFTVTNALRDDLHLVQTRQA